MTDEPKAPRHNGYYGAGSPKQTLARWIVEVYNTDGACTFRGALLDESLADAINRWDVSPPVREIRILPIGHMR